MKSPALSTTGRGKLSRAFVRRLTKTSGTRCAPQSVERAISLSLLAVLTGEPRPSAGETGGLALLTSSGRESRARPLSVPPGGICEGARNTRWTSRFQRERLPATVGATRGRASPSDWCVCRESDVQFSCRRAVFAIGARGTREGGRRGRCGERLPRLGRFEVRCCRSPGLRSCRIHETRRTHTTENESPTIRRSTSQSLPFLSQNPLPDREQHTVQLVRLVDSTHPPVVREQQSLELAHLG